MKSIVIITLCFFNISLSAQKTVDVNSNYTSGIAPSFFEVVAGEPLATTKFTKLVAGSPYFNDEWMKGSATINGGNEYSNLQLKLDLFDNEVHFRNANGTELIATAPIQKLQLFDSASQQVFSFVNGAFIESNTALTGWYQLLTSGKAMLFKKIGKYIEENKPYGSATVEQTITSSSHYYILLNKTFTEIKKLKDVPAIFSNKQVTDYINSKTISVKNEDDLKEIVNYFNGLN